MIRVYFEYTNTEDEDTAFYWRYSPYAFQDGYALESTSVEKAMPEDENLMHEIAPGETIESAMVFTLRSGSPIVLLVSEDSSDLVCAKVATR